MTWFALSLAAAFLMATNGAYMKKFFSDVSPWEMAIIPFFYSVPMCTAGIIFSGIPKLGPGFYPALSWVLPMMIVSVILHFRAIHMSPLSLTLPFLSFTPVFALITGDFFLGEKLSGAGISGMALVVIGGYVLNLDSTRFGFWGPIKAIYREPGSAIMLAVAAMYGFTSVGGKVMIIHSSALFTGFLIFVLLGILIPIILIGVGKASLGTILRKPLLGFGSGFIVFTEIICHNIAISMVAAAYMITIKRMAGIFSVIYGWILFHERGIRYRLIGTAIMTVGASIIAIYG
ncbi:DMT family transporter [Pseudodesulfovibrio sp. zrk46]|uniref:DMT family transporter n=1 Tax=Pseudodesulfovibrio sp. zrk46 TaxID=2725288 RepID=UPI001449B863|nr:DMT family transporter [Pseudodesulfovibrio sp. zrk46]QJB58007.1 DMT family transporter [Pseudodesulfovibrio sp. zrk46]